MSEQRDLSGVDLGALLDHPERVGEVPAAELPAIVLRLAALQSAVAARLTAEATSAPAASEQAPEKLLDVRQAAERVGMSADWLYRHKDKLPFTRLVGTRTVRFSDAGITRWLAHRTR
jgi:predicted DNA-binding transcriptional regulator AlpA